MPSLTLSKWAINRAIMAFEVSWSPVTGWAAYNRKYRKPIVPVPDTTESGVTFGLGFDCGQCTAAEIREAWGSILSKDWVDKLVKCAGKKKYDAVAMLDSLKGLEIPIEDALKVFYNTTIFKFAKETYRIYPDVVKVHPVEQSVFVGLVYNRGNDLTGDRRKEMKELVGAIKRDIDTEMASIIRHMQRLWANVKGLRIRRDAEADLILLADTPINENDKLVINF